jgi:hypothetical protein
MQDGKKPAVFFFVLHKQDSFDRLGTIRAAGGHNRAPAKHVRSGPKHIREIRYSLCHLI